MGSIFLAVLWLGFLMSEINFAESRNDVAKLSRRKRYVAFPEGATLSIAICMTIQTIIYQNMEVFSEGINWGISYDLPNKTAILKDLYFPSSHAMQRRNRRDLYQKMEVVMDSMGYNGRDCIFRALCEAGAIFNKNGNSFLMELLRIVFGFPQEKLLPSEPDEHEQYLKAHKLGKKNGIEECFQKFSGCNFSLLDMALGHYGESFAPLPT